MIAPTIDSDSGHITVQYLIHGLGQSWRVTDVATALTGWSQTVHTQKFVLGRSHAQTISQAGSRMCHVFLRHFEPLFTVCPQLSIKNAEPIIKQYHANEDVAHPEDQNQMIEVGGHQLTVPLCPPVDVNAAMVGRATPHHGTRRFASRHRAPPRSPKTRCGREICCPHTFCNPATAPWHKQSSPTAAFSSVVRCGNVKP